MNNDRHLDHEQLRDDLAAYALGALQAEEAEELEDHLEECSRCRELLRWLSPAVDVLPAAVPQRTPPPRLRENLMAVVHSEAEAAGTTPQESRQRPSERWWRRLSVPVVRPAGALAAAGLLAAGLAGGYLIGHENLDDQAPTFVEAKPAGELGGNPNVSATLELRDGSGTLHVNELPRLPRDRVYEVWIERAGVMEPSTIFVLDRNGAAAAAIPGPLTGADRVLVTSEPRGGSQRPTSPPVLTAPL